MTATPRKDWRAYAWPTAAALFAVSLQVLTTIEFRGVSLRVSSSDLLLPVLALMLLVKWARAGNPWPEWRIRYFWVWLALLTLWMAVSIINGRLRSGGWETWVLVNKGIGWTVLVVYLLAGAWMAAFIDIRARDWFLRSFIFFGCAVSIFILMLHSLAIYGLIPVTGETFFYPRPTGFFANPNAFGIAAAAMCALLVPYVAYRRLFPLRATYFGIALLCAIVFVSISRSAWIGLSFAILAFVITGVLHWRDFLKVATVFMGLVFMTLYGPRIIFEGAAFSLDAITVISERILADSGNEDSLGDGNEDSLGDGNEDSLGDIESLWSKRRQPQLRNLDVYLGRAVQSEGDTGVSERVAMVHAALDSWRKAPIMGTGLGTYNRAYRDTPNVADTIHNTFLWLLTETGVIGAGLFTGFFLTIFLALIRTARGSSEKDPFVLGVLGVLLVFAGASIGTEILYQRYFWFLLGLALCLRSASPSQSSSERQNAPYA